MNPFSYERAPDQPAALALGARAGAKYLGGGTNLVDLMREAIERPDSLVDVTGLSCAIEEMEDGGLRIGGGVKNTAVARRPPRARTLSTAGAGDPGGRLRPDPQHGDGGRQPSAAHPLQLLL